MKLEKNVQVIEVFYDGHCGMCSSFAEWLVKQGRAIKVDCMAYQSDKAKRVFPEIDSLKPDCTPLVMHNKELGPGEAVKISTANK